jgi:pimeloyl-ACP methyl ester carboxylesterase
MIDVPGGQLHARFNLDAGTTPLVVQHDAASSTTTVEPIVRSFIGRRNVLAFDMPGSGKSDNIINSDHANVQDYSDSLAAALDEMDLDQIDFYGMWGGGFVGSELSFTQPHRVRRLVMSNLFFHEGEELKKFQNNYTPPIEPAWHGGHLLQCWHQMRDQGLFFPWFDRSLDGIIRREPFLDVDMVHDRVCSLLQAGNMYRTAYQAHFVYPVRQRLRKLNIPTLLATTEWDPNRPHTEQLAAENRHCQFQMLSPDFQRWGISFLPFLEHR